MSIVLLVLTRKEKNDSAILKALVLTKYYAAHIYPTNLISTLHLQVTNPVINFFWIIEYFGS